MADVESLASLPRKEIQRQAKEAGIKANQTNEALISALCALRVSSGGQQDGGSTHCTPKSGTPGSMGSARRAFGSELSASKANQPMAARRRLLKTLSEDSASPIAVEPPSSRKGLVLASPGLAMGMSPLVAHRLSTTSLSSSAVPSPADWSRSKLAEPSFNSRSMLVEGDTVELTVARLRALGFGEEDARWAAEEAKVRQEEEGDEHDISLSLDLSCLRIDDKVEAEAKVKADKCSQEAESGGSKLCPTFLFPPSPFSFSCTLSPVHPGVFLHRHAHTACRCWQPKQFNPEVNTPICSVSQRGCLERNLFTPQHLGHFFTDRLDVPNMEGGKHLSFAQLPKRQLGGCG